MLQTKYQIKSHKASNGAEAIECVKNNYTKTCCEVYINVIFMDIKMPVMGGIAATEKIFALYNNLISQGKRNLPKLHICAVTAYLDKTIDQSAKDVGCT